MALTKFFRVAVEGATVDGREISRQQIDQMAASYRPETYTARINCEHLRGYSPDAPFNAWGSIAAVKSEDVNIELGGKSQKRRALFAQFDVTDQAKAYNEAGQKLFSSVEIQDNFARTNAAYLVGLAVTDSPASLGTEVLKFSRDDARKEFLVQVGEFTVEYEDAPPAADAATSAFAAMANFFKTFGKAPEPVTPPAPVQQPAGQPDISAFTAGLAAQFEAMTSGITASFTALETRIAAQADALKTFKAEVENTVSPNHKSRNLSSGGANRVKAEC